MYSVRAADYVKNYFQSFTNTTTNCPDLDVKNNRHWFKIFFYCKISIFFLISNNKEFTNRHIKCLVINDNTIYKHEFCNSVSIKYINYFFFNDFAVSFVAVLRF